MEKQKTEGATESGSCCAPSCCAPEAKAADVREVVREKYGQAVKAVTRGAKPSCCGSSAKDAPLGFTDPITRDLYDTTDTASLPEEAVLASFGCGNPTALAELKPGEVVLDLGSGGGIDVLLSAKRVGASGMAYGLDMTDEMLDLANKNKEKAGAKNVVFLKGTIESVPLPSNSVDVIISNCVINLSGDKDAVIREAFRVLKPGGRFAVSDIVLQRSLPESARQSMELWTGCVAGALLGTEYETKLRTAGFTDVGIEPTRVYDQQSVREMAQATEAFGAGGAEVERLIAELDGAIVSAFVRATKPLTS
jgi:arsenite methyltransferase